MSDQSALQRAIDLLPDVTKGLLTERSAILDAMQFVDDANAQDFVWELPSALRTELMELLAREELVPEPLRRRAQLAASVIKSEFGLQRLVAPSCWEEGRDKLHAERAKNNARWSGQERSCPRCDTLFVSVQDRGACPSCQHVFYASDPHCADTYTDGG